MFSGKQHNNRINSLYLLGIFVADENHDGVDVNAVQTFNGVRSDVEQTVAVLRKGRQIQRLNGQSLNKA